MGQHTFVVPAAKDVVEGWPVACLEETHHEAETQECTIRLRTCEGEGKDCPAKLLKWDPNWQVSTIVVRGGDGQQQCIRHAYCEQVPG